jgi:hypothetical protein
MLAEYLQLYSPATDAPRQFHVFCCLTAIAAVLGRRVWLQDGPQRLYPNLFTLLLAPSSLYRKSTCTGIATGVLRALEGPPDPRHEAEDGRPGAERLLFPNLWTPESLLEILQNQPAGLLVIDEFRMLLDGMRRDYMSGTRELLMSLYDCRDIHRKIRSAEFQVREPAVSLLAGCATRWFTDATKAGELRSGFYARLTMVPAWTKDTYLVRGQAPARSDVLHLERTFAALRKVSGEMTLARTQEQALGEWAISKQHELQGLEHEAELASFYTRLERVALKLAMILQVAADPGSREISNLMLADALELVDWLQANLRRLFEDEFTFSRDMEQRQRLLAIVAKYQPIERRVFLRYSHLTVRDFQPLLDTLLQEGSIRFAKLNGEKPGFVLSQLSQPVTRDGVTPKGGGSSNVST